MRRDQQLKILNPEEIEKYVAEIEKEKEENEKRKQKKESIVMDKRTWLGAILKFQSWVILKDASASPFLLSVLSSVCNKLVH